MTTRFVRAWILVVGLCASASAQGGLGDAVEPVGATPDAFYHGIRPDTSPAPPLVLLDELVLGPYWAITGIAFNELGHMLFWTRSGIVSVAIEGEVVAGPSLLDIREEVADWRDHGLMSVAFDPDYLFNGFIYLLYAVDRHHLDHFGSASYDPDASEEYVETVGRITRYRVVDPSDPSSGVDPASRTVLLGESLGTGFPICGSSHGVGKLAFGHDGSLLASCGDSSQNELPECLSSGILQPKEDVSFYRSQLVDSLCGKVIRIDPSTGDGLPDNPRYDASRPRSAASRMWVSGLRQPFRYTVVPEHAAEHGSGHGNGPGVLIIGDVGDTTWEELNVAPHGGMNFGFPIYAGMQLSPNHNAVLFENLDAPNPLFGQFVPGLGLCTQEFFHFQDLLAEESPFPGELPNPCDPNTAVPAGLLSEHTRPALTWEHDNPVTLARSYDALGQPSVELIGSTGSSVSGEAFSGSCSIGGVWYDGDHLPLALRGTYFHADCVEGWIKAIRFGPDRLPEEIIHVTSEAGHPVALEVNPVDGTLYYVDYRVEQGLTVVRRISNPDDFPPRAVITANRSFGFSPLAVQFRSDESTDPEGGTLTYGWDFGDGSPTSDLASPLHEYVVPSGEPTLFSASLTVTDEAGLQAASTFEVSVNNAPPSVQILSPPRGMPYSTTELVTVPLLANVSDAEHGPDELDCAWELILHHDTHAHSDALNPACASSTTLFPHASGDGDVLYYEQRLTVTDAHGLATTVSHDLQPESDCNLNGIVDAVEIAGNLALDTDLDGRPDECQVDCNGNGMNDAFELALNPDSDCDGNGIPDGCDIASGASDDFDQDGRPDRCQSLSVDRRELPVSTGGTQVMSIETTEEFAYQAYRVLGSLNGISPGFPLEGFHLPLNPGPYLRITVEFPNVPPLIGTDGLLDGNGSAEARFSLLPGAGPAFVGLHLDHVVLVLDAVHGDLLHVSGPMPLDLVP